MLLTPQEEEQGFAWWLVGLGALVLWGLFYYLFGCGPGGTVISCPPESYQEPPPIIWQSGEIECVGQADCMKQAKFEYEVGLAVANSEKLEVGQRFAVYMHMSKAEEYLKKAGKVGIPAEFSELDPTRQKARVELDQIFQQTRVNHYKMSKRKQYADMVDELESIKAQFHHKGAKEHQWALTMERRMKDEGNYPQRF